MVPLGFLLGAAWAGDVHALLINGGGDAESNMQSHLGHLRAMRDVLIARGVKADDIDVFCSDGGDPAPDMAVGEAGEDTWLLLFTPAQDLAGVRQEDSRIEGVELLPATRAALDQWFRTEAPKLRRGDTLLVYTTDHGTPGGLVLWGESMAPYQLGRMLDRVPAGVTVVTAMSQCFAGGFADAVGERDSCGIYAVPADRKAFGCYAQGSDGEMGHAYRLAAALRSAPTLAAAQDLVLVTDDSPDMPVRTSDLWIEELLDQQSLLQGRPVAEIVDEWLTGVPLDGTPIDAITRQFFLPPRPTANEVEGMLVAASADRSRSEQAKEELIELARALLTDNFNRLLVTTPKWATQSWKVAGPDRAALVAGLTADLEAQAERDGHMTALRALESRLEGFTKAWWEINTHAAALERVRLVLHQVAFDHAPAGLIPAREIERVEALRRCEAAPLGTPPQATPVATPASTPPGPALPLLRDDGFDLDRLGDDGTITAVARDSSAARAGVRGGDRIVSPTGGGAWLFATLALHPPEQPLELDLVRDGVPVHVVLPATTLR